MVPDVCLGFHLLSFQKKLAVLTETLARAIADLSQFMFLFMIMFVAFASSALIFFGSQVLLCGGDKSVCGLLVSR